MSETIRQQVESYEVKKAPKDTSLESILSTYTKNQLGDLIDANDFSIAKSKKKAEVVEELSEAILNHLSESTSLNDKEVYTTLETQILPNLPVSLEEWADASETEAKHVETLVAEGLALVTPEEIYVADEVAEKVKEHTPSSSKESTSESTQVADVAPSSKDEKKTVYKSNAASNVVNLKEQKQKRQAFLKKMARKKKKGKKKK